VNAARQLAVTSTSVSLNWNQIESRPHRYVDPNKFLFLINTYYPRKAWSVGLSFRPMDTNGRQVPADFARVSFDDSRMISRFKELLDFVYRRMPRAKLNLVSIGNETTLAYPANHRFWKAYKTFLRRAKDHSEPSPRIRLSGQSVRWTSWWGLAVT